MHIPVLLEETIKALDPKPGENFIDATFGWGGHAQAILERNAPGGLVLGLDRDKESLESFKASGKTPDKRLILENTSFAEIRRVASLHNLEQIDGALFDLGMSSWHLDESKKGFSFLKDEPLDMRFDTADPLTAARIVNEWPAADLEKIFKEYGEEEFARKAAKEIEKARRQKMIETTRQLAGVIGKALPAGSPELKRRSYSRIFQALRIAANRELENIDKGLAGAFEIMAPGGRLAVISFHSLEDRLVKTKFREWAGQGRAKLIFKKPVTPAPEEIGKNPRAKSAKLRAIVKTQETRNIEPLKRERKE